MSLMRQQKRFLLLALLSLLWFPPPAGPAAPEAAAQRPRLIVVVVIDQFRADYLVRFRDQFGPDGFNRLLRQGAHFTSCFYPYAATVTAAGHATLATGTTPNRHGIARNQWYDLERGKMVEAVEDEAYPLVGTSGAIAGVSPRNLLGTTLADELRLATNGEGKVFGVALKDRAAVFSTGHTASGAYWYSSATGAFATSRYYRQELPDWVVTFNEQRGAHSYYGKAWAAGDKVVTSMITESGQPDADFYRQFPYTPYGNDIVVDFARELVAQEKLGADAATDFLFVGFSSNDLVGHRWGPYSEEVADITLRTDKQMAELFKFLDEQVGAGSYWLVLSADHGVAPTLEQARARGLPAKNVDAEALTKALNKAFEAQWGADEWFLSGRGILFNRETLRQHGVGIAQAAQVAGGVLQGIDGIRGYVAEEESHLDAALTKAVRHSMYRGRGRDVEVVLEPFALYDGERRGGTTHGSPYSYDTHVPLILYGAPFRSRAYRERVSPTDLAPTLAAALGLSPPALANGNVLVQALRRRRPPTSRPGSQ